MDVPEKSEELAVLGLHFYRRTNPWAQRPQAPWEAPKASQLTTVVSWPVFNFPSQSPEFLIPGRQYRVPTPSHNGALQCARVRDWSVISGSGSQAFSVKKECVNSLDFVGRTISVAATRLCCRSTKAAIGDPSVNGRVRVPIKFYLWKQVDLWAIEFANSWHRRKKQKQKQIQRICPETITLYKGISHQQRAFNRCGANSSPSGAQPVKPQSSSTCGCVYTRVDVCALNPLLIVFILKIFTDS